MQRVIPKTGKNAIAFTSISICLLLQIHLCVHLFLNKCFSFHFHRHTQVSKRLCFPTIIRKMMIKRMLNRKKVLDCLHVLKQTDERAIRRFILVHVA